MSKIIHYLKCKECGKEYKDIYISFGHPDESFDWKWKCDNCEHINTVRIIGLEDELKAGYGYTIDRWK